MANSKWNFDGLEEYTKKLQKLAAPKEYRAMIKQAVYVGAGIVADEVRRRLERHNSDGGENELLGSMYLAQMEEDDGYIYTELGFGGYDSKGVPNILKMRALESGTQKQRKTPVIRPAIRAKQRRAVEAMSEKLDELIQKTMEE